jgi:hypothetical protein
MSLVSIIVMTLLSLSFVLADERDVSLITAMEGRRLEPGERKRIQNNGECYILESVGGPASFIPDRSQAEVATIGNTGIINGFTRTSCGLSASAGKLLKSSENILNNPSNFTTSDFLVIKVAGLTQNARACNRRMWGVSSGRTSEPADECIAANVASNSARMADMNDQNGKPLWTYNPVRSEWTLTKEVGVTGLRFGGSIDFVFYDPTMGAGLQMGTNAVALSVQLTGESITASAPTGTGGSGDGGGEDSGGYDGGDPDNPASCTPTTAGTSLDGIDNDCDGTIDEPRSVANEIFLGNYEVLTGGRQGTAGCEYLYPTTNHSTNGGQFPCTVGDTKYWTPLGATKYCDAAYAYNVWKCYRRSNTTYYD